MRKKKKQTNRRQETRFIRNMSGNNKESDWTKAKLRTLIVSMKRRVPEKARRKAYRKGGNPVDWKKVAFPPFSPEACQQKWEKMLNKIHKTRSLTDLIIEAEEAVKANECKLHCEPKSPSGSTLSSYQVFIKEQMSLQREKFPDPSERCTEVIKIWRALSREEKKRYKRKEDENEMMKYSRELWKWFKTLTPAEQEDYLTRNPRKRKYFRVTKNTFYEKKEPDLHRPSDSEDDDIEYSSSDEEAIDWDCEEEEMEEEEGDDMFEMYW